MSDDDLVDVLVAFLEAHFHAEWTYEAPTWEVVVDAFTLQSTPESVRRLAQAFDRLDDASPLGEALRQGADSATFSLDAASDLTTERWLTAIADRLHLRGRRDALVADHQAVLEALEDALADGEPEADRHERQRQQLRDEYADLLPWVAVARCPFTDEATFVRIDVGGLDGPWWDFRDPVRPFEESLPSTFLELTGALGVDHVPSTVFLAVPGPEVPYVLPGLLGRDGVVAVLTSLRVGDFDAFTVSYFVDQATSNDVRPPPAWGAEESTPRSGAANVDPTLALEANFDFELRPWIERDKLLWVVPMDSTLELRSGTQDCPYLDLPGRRSVIHLQGGRAWQRDPRTGEAETLTL